MDADRTDPNARWPDGAILRESERWIHVPQTGTLVEDSERLLVHLPGHQGPSRVWRSWPERGRAEAVIEETVEEVRAAGGTRLVWHTGDAVSPLFMDDLLAKHGFEKTEDLEVLAFELGEDPHPKLPRLHGAANVSTDLIRDEVAFREAHAVESSIFPNAPELAEPEIRGYLRGLKTLELQRPQRSRDDHQDPCTLRFVASVRDPQDGTRLVVATAGAQLAGKTVRLWGAGTLPEHRRRSAYGALVVRRCRFAHGLGATLALTKANTSSSVPILRKAGFRPIATERRHTLQITPQGAAGSIPAR